MPPPAVFTAPSITSPVLLRHAISVDTHRRPASGGGSSSTTAKPQAPAPPLPAACAPGGVPVPRALLRALSCSAVEQEPDLSLR